ALEDLRVGHARPIVGDDQPASTAGPPGQPYVEPGALRRVYENVAQQGIHARGQVVRADPHRYRYPADPVLHQPVLLLGQRRPDPYPRGDHRARVAEALAGAPAGGPDDVVDGALERVQVGTQPVTLAAVLQRLGVDAQRRQRGTQPVRQVGHGLPFPGEQLVDPPGEMVEPGADLAYLGRPAGPGARVEIPSGEMVYDLHDRAQRPDQCRAEPVRD